MLHFSNKQIKELQALFKKELGLEVSEKEASLYAKQLVDLICVVYKDDPTFCNNSPPD